MFDGVHRGHQFVLQQVIQTARELGMQSMVITFDHPFRGPVLTSKAAKQLLLSKMGIDRIEMLSFTDRLRQMTARQFMQQELKERLGVSVLLTGYDNRFGHQRAEGFDDYVRYGRELGIEVRALPPAPQQEGEPTVSSSLIRELLAKGRIVEATEALGYPYTILGRVGHGCHVGTSLGFPTANLELDDPKQLLPPTGAYAVKVRKENSVEWKHGMMNIGMRPTVSDSGHMTLEVHIFRLNEDLYGQQLLVSFFDRLRSEQRFDSTDQLVAQLQEDARQAERILQLDD